MNIKTLTYVIAASLATVASPVAAQAATATNDTSMATPLRDDDEDRDFPWGLLGLLGLAGLLGRKRDNDTNRNRNDTVGR